MPAHLMIGNMMKHYAIVLALVAAPVFAHGFSAGKLDIAHPWTRETAPNQKVGGGFMKITNRGVAADRLIAATSPAATEVQIHTMSMDGGVMRMRQLGDGIAIPAGGTVSLQPGGFHIMFIGLKKPFKQGAVIPAELRFEKAGKVKVQFAVEAVGYKGTAGGGHDEH